MHTLNWVGAGGEGTDFPKIPKKKFRGDNLPFVPPDLAFMGGGQFFSQRGEGTRLGG